MQVFSDIVANCTEFTDSDRKWLHHLIMDWRVIADLSFSDLLLVVPDDEGRLVIAAQCRSSTVISAYSEDVTGRTLDESLVYYANKAMSECSYVRIENIRRLNGIERYGVMTPVKHGNRILGVVMRESGVDRLSANGRFESESILVGRILFRMIGQGSFPAEDMSSRSNRYDLRVSDGFVTLSAEGVIEYSSPNAVTCFRHLGHEGVIDGLYLSDIVTNYMQPGASFPDTLPVALSGKVMIDSEVNTEDACLSFISFPLYDYGTRIGAVVVVGDITERRNAEKLLETKDASISEVHHRVKNNLQAVSSLLRLQARRTDNEEVRRQLKEAQRRVETIATVHEGLSQTGDEMVNFDKVISNILNMSVNLSSSPNQKINVSYEGSFGLLPAQDATPLSLILTELTVNCVEHGFENLDTGNIIVSAYRVGKSLTVVIEDDGIGIEEEKTNEALKSKDSGLGTQIINTFVKNDFNGSIKWQPREGGGTKVTLNLNLRAIA